MVIFPGTQHFLVPFIIGKMRCEKDLNEQEGKK